MKLQLKYPVTYIRFNQKFGENGVMNYKKMGLPGHNGIDFYTKHGEPIMATHDGRAYYQIDSAGGHGVVLISDTQFDDNEGGECFYKSIYWHLVDPIKEPKYKSPIQDFPWGKQVKAGDVIGYADSTGNSTGDHLHFGLKPVAKSGESQNSWDNIQQNNGYYGAIDPYPFFETITPDKVPLTFFQRLILKNMKDGVVFKDGKWVYNIFGYQDYKNNEYR